MDEPEFSQPLFNNTIKYLNTVATVVPNFFPVLKSYYSAKFRILEEKGNVYLPHNKNKAKARCPRCCMNLTQGRATCRVKPEKKRSRFSEKISRKKNENGRLTSFQMKYTKKLQQGHTNHLVVTCKFCKNEVAHALSKPTKEVVEVNLEHKKAKKKKKTKDKLCGLNAQAVSAAKLCSPSAKNKSQKSQQFVSKNNTQMMGKKKKAAANVGNNQNLGVKVSSKKKAHMQQKAAQKLGKLLTTVGESKKIVGGLVQFLKNFQ